METAAPSKHKCDQTYRLMFLKHLEHAPKDVVRTGTKRKLTCLCKMSIDDVLQDIIVPEQSQRPKAKLMKYLKRKEREINEQKRKEEYDTDMKCYLSQRKKREKFRENLIKTIVGCDDGSELDSNSWMTDEDMELLRYYYYIMYGFDDVYVAPMDDEMLNNILKLIPPNYVSKYRSTLEKVVQEAKEDYKLSVKKAVVDFVLKEPMMNSTDIDEQKEISKEMLEIQSFPADHSTNYLKTRSKLSKQLILYHPCMRRVLNIWFREFDTTKLADIGKFKSQLSYDSSEFSHKILDMIERTKKSLFKNWLPKAYNVCQTAHKKGTLPDESSKLKSKFWNCLATVMENHLQRLCLKSIADYMDLLKEIGNNNSGFILNATIKNGCVSFEPSFELFADTLLLLLNSFPGAISRFPRIEAKFYQDQPLCYLKPIVLDEIIERHSSSIFLLVDENKLGPETQNREFDKYVSLINEEEKKIVEAFVKADPPQTFEDYGRLIKKYHELSRAIPNEFELTVFIGLFEMRRTNLIDHMIHAANHLKQDLLNKMVADYQRKSKAISKEYQEIADRALSTPPNTSELMVLRSFIHKAETEIMINLEGRLREVLKYIVFLSDYTLLSSLEIKTNNSSFQWFVPKL